MLRLKSMATTPYSYCPNQSIRLLSLPASFSTYLDFESWRLLPEFYQILLSLAPILFRAGLSEL